MECDYKILTQEKFNQRILKFKSRKDLYYFIYNTLCQIIYSECCYCFCNKYLKKITEMKIIKSMKIILHYVRCPLFFQILKRTFQIICLMKVLFGGTMENWFFSCKRYLKCTSQLCAVFWIMRHSLRAETGTWGKHDLYLSETKLITKKNSK